MWNWLLSLFGITGKLNEYGWKPDTPDIRDYEYTPAITSLPPRVDLRATDSPIYDQGQLGSCTANAIGAMFQFVTRKMKGRDYYPSRLFIYYGARLIEGTVNRDAGSAIRDGMKVIHKQGAPDEILWPYVISKFKLTPPSAAYADGKAHQSIKYMRIARNLATMKQCIADGYPFVFGFTVYQSFRNSKGGIIPLPSKTEQPLGGHAVMAIGYDDAKQCFIVRNSWGTWWGDKGYCYMPYGFFTNAGLSRDFWTLRTVET